MIKNTLIPIDGFQFSSIHSGIKKKRKDLSIIYCPEGASCGATFTTNKTKAAPVVLSEQNMQSAKIKAIIINSGNANACTGTKGYIDASHTATLAAILLNIDPSEVLIASTGIIGVPLPMSCIEKGLPLAVQSLDKNKLAAVAEGIMTTDTLMKTFSSKLTFGDTSQVASFSGIAKGSGMIHPNMATMLGFVMTDVAIDGDLLKSITKEIVNETFNMVTVDGDTSTNDMFVVMASGALGNPLLTKDSLDLPAFKTTLYALCKALAISIASDGEGATKLLQAKLYGAHSDQDAKRLAKSVVASSLVKAAFFGMDANWGRIICALGYADAHFNPDQLTLNLKSENGRIALMEKGQGLLFDEAHALEVLRAPIIDIEIQLYDGPYNAEAWGCDLTYDYVKINGAYRS